ncbi:MAG TPA: nuclear transport factor 2 family protein [Longimicrobium sp.]|jgi:uncharacterized protein (TIGR02246 family)|nr:nuclear transport factor 2 family protein [Longimicrobium sp.]
MLRIIPTMPQTAARISAAAAGLLLLLGHAPALSAQRDIFGMGGSSAAEVRRQFEAEARQQVSALLLDYESAWGSRDVSALSRLYAGNATLYPAASPMLTGRAGIKDYFRALLPAVEPLRTRMIEFRASGDMAYTAVEVSYAVRDGAGRRSVANTDVLILRRGVTGEWSILSHLARPETVAASSGGDRPPAVSTDTAQEL